MADNKMSLNEKASEILRKAEQYDLENNVLFTTTFQGLTVQLKILADLEKVIRTQEALVTKEYVKGRGNIYVHPAINEYNKTRSSANNTVVTLLKIIDKAKDQENKGDEHDPLWDILNGGGMSEE